MVASSQLTHKTKISSPTERQRIRSILATLPGVAWQEKDEQYCEYRLDGKQNGGWLRAKQFTNGTLYLEASAAPLLEAMLSRLGFENAPQPVAGNLKLFEKPKITGDLQLTGTYIGTDESGKGDYFGPLVIAGVMVTEETAPILRELGVMDSKKLTDKLIADLALQITQVVGASAVGVLEIGPKKYNELYDKFKQGGRNLNHLLAWGHAKTIENLLEANPTCPMAVADQFGSEHYIKSQLQERGKGIQLLQTPKAEANVGVAAASILARNRFVQKLRKLGQPFGIDLPPGASALVKTRAKAFVQAHGREKLGEVAKLHFKTTLELGC